MIEEVFAMGGGEGVGAGLLRAWLQQTGVGEELEALVDTRDTVARAWYERLGWERERWWEGGALVHATGRRRGEVRW